MKIAFLDSSRLDYTPDTPYERPLGGSQSALCYLAENIAALGHEVWLLNSRAEPVVSRGVTVASLTEHLPVLTGMDVVVVLNGIHTEMARALRQTAPAARLVFWTQHAHDQPAVGNLKDPAMRGLWDAFVLISDWQAERFRLVFDLPADRIRILRNAIGPAFAGRAPAPRPWPPVLAYTSTPFRGLDLLLEAFPRIRAAVPGTVLRVFSSMGVYQVAREQDPHTTLYERCRTMEGVEYIGSLPQPELAEALQGVSMLAYPNSFAETSCISVMEALASGCTVVTSELGALPETAGGWGHLLPLPPQQEVFVAGFADLVIDVLRDMERAPERAAGRMRRQVTRMNADTVWSVRAREWADWLALLAGGTAGGTGLAVPGTLPLGGGRAVTRGRHGLFLTDGSTHEGLSLQRYGEWLEGAVRVMSYVLRPGERAIVTGAGEGGLVVPLAKRVGLEGRVLALSHDGTAHRWLTAALALNGLDRVEAPLPSGGARMDIDVVSAGWDRCRLLRAGGPEPLAVLAGAEKLIARCRPFVHVPLSGEADFDILSCWAAERDYRLYWCPAPFYSPDNVFGRVENLLGRGGEVAVLAVPAEAGTVIVGQEARAFAEIAPWFAPSH